MEVSTSGLEVMVLKDRITFKKKQGRMYKNGYYPSLLFIFTKQIVRQITGEGMF